MPSLSTVDLSQLREQLFSGSRKNQFQAIEILKAGDGAAWEILQDFLLASQSQTVTSVGGSAYRALVDLDRDSVQDFLQSHFADGFVPLNSEAGVDYRPIEQTLIAEAWEEADRLTLQKMCELAGPLAVQRKWLYFSEVDQFSVTDMRTIDTLWRVYSQDKFGFSVQREIWLSVGQTWERLWPQIGWKSDNIWTRYPDAFTWDISAPKGHFPLTNQLRGVRVMASLMNHPAFSD
jgi:hypothetical protein